MNEAQQATIIIRILREVAANLKQIENKLGNIRTSMPRPRTNPRLLTASSLGVRPTRPARG